jgi:hypothetical protein
VQVQAQAQAPLQVAVLLQPRTLADVLAREREREQVSALEMTAAPLRRAPACLVRRLL